MIDKDAFELRWVRAASCGASCCALLAVLMLASLPMPIRTDFDATPAVTAVLVAQAPRVLHTPDVPPDVAPHARALAPAQSISNDAPAPRLWTYSPSGQIVFDWPEQYARCIRARARRASEADCPDPAEPAELVLRAGARPSFDLSGLILASSE